MVRLMESGDVFGHAAAVRCIFECDVGEQHKCECLILDPVLRALPSVGRERERGGTITRVNYGTYNRSFYRAFSECRVNQRLYSGVKVKGYRWESKLGLRVAFNTRDYRH